jgi:hypothetical protein
MRSTRVAPLLVGLTACAMSCTEVPPPSAPVANDAMYWTLRFNHHAITMGSTAPYDTITLTATPRNAQGQPIPTTAKPVYTVSDPTTLAINAKGVLTALQPNPGLNVVASLTIGRVTLTDTALINVNVVTPPVPVLASLSIHPVPGLDSANANAGMFSNLYSFVVDTKGDTLSNILVYWQSSDSSVATTDQFGDIFAYVPGQTTMYAEATVYGVSKSDSVTFTVDQPFLSNYLVSSRVPTGSTKPVSYFASASVTVAPFGFVVWNNASGQPIDVVFDDPSAAQAVPPTWDPVFEAFYNLDSPNNPNLGGNIAAFATQDSTSGADGVGLRIRYFPIAGTYHFHSALYGTTGAVVVSLH